MNHLRRELSPVLPEAYRLIESKAREVLVSYLAARKLVDFEGPLGFTFSAIPLGRVREIPAPAGAQARVRLNQPMLELRVPFQLSLAELDNVARGADDIDVEPVAEAARALALLEDSAVFYGLEAAQMKGMVPTSLHRPLALTADFRDFPGLVSEAIARLHTAGVSGPYAIALDSESHSALLRAAGPGGYPVLQHIRKLAEGPTVFAPALKGALVSSMRGGDFKLTLGQDASIGYLAHDQSTVQLYLEETLTFRVLGPEAVVSLPPRSASGT
jgi:uncharacterized linocin/CFP29 family protein